MIRPPSTLPAASVPVIPAPMPSNSTDFLQLLLSAPHMLTALQAMTHPTYGAHPYYAPHPPPPTFVPAPTPAGPSEFSQPPEVPPVVLPRVIHLNEYFERYQINADDRRVLTELGYKPGDDGIKVLDKETWDSVRVAPLAKGRILRQHNAFMKDVIAGLWN